MSKQRTFFIGLLTLIATTSCGKKEAPAESVLNVPVQTTAPVEPSAPTASATTAIAPTPPVENVPASPLLPPPELARLPESTSAKPAASPTPTPAAPPIASATTLTASTAAAVVPVPASAPVPPPPQLDLAKRSGCLACHSIEKKVVGPAWDEVSKRYAGDATAKTKLVEKVKKGGKGNWLMVTGGATMPPYSPRVSDADIETLVDFVLSLQTK